MLTAYMLFAKKQNQKLVTKPEIQSSTSGKAAIATKTKAKTFGQTASCSNRRATPTTSRWKTRMPCPKCKQSRLYLALN